MEDKNPLELTAFILPKKSVRSNVRGRPTYENATKFTPQPKSIISRLLRRVRNQKCENITKISLNATDDNTSSIIICNSENNVHSKNNSILDEFKLINTQESYNVEWEEDRDNIKNSLVDNEQTHIQSNTTNTLWDKNCDTVPKLLDIACYVCSHRSSSQQAHRKHLSIHRNQPYACNFPNCNYTCKLSCNLIKHKRIHTSEKPFLCDQCTFRSNFANSLKVHKRIHTSERPYGCQYCSYKCNSSSNLKKHCRHKHRTVS